jgi:hypothetical protein
MAKWFSVSEFVSAARRSSGSVITVIVDIATAASPAAPKPASSNTAAPTAATSAVPKDAWIIATASSGTGAASAKA